MQPNRIREKLNAGEPTLATHVHTTWPGMIEIVGLTGIYDYVEFVAEYAPFNLHDLENFCRAAELHNLSTMIKVDQAPRTFLAQRAIGAGFQSVLFADSRTIADAEECVRAVRADTPDARGLHGVAMRRAWYMSYGAGPDYPQALDDIVVALMIERKSAVDQLDEFLEVKGVDMVQWGPADYAMNIGRAGEFQHPDVKAAEKKVFETCLAKGVAPRAEINSVEQAQRFLDMGVTHFCMGTDINIMYDWLRDQGDTLRNLLSKA